MQRLGKRIGSGFQGTVFASSLDDKKVIKRIPLFKKKGGKKVDASGDVKKTIHFMKLASDAGVGPVVYEVFYDNDNVYIEMEHVSVQDPTKDDADDIIRLYEKMLRNNFLTYDSEFARRLHGPRKGQWVIIDYGVSEAFPDYKHALKALVSSGLLEDAGIGYYHPKLERHFTQKHQKANA